MRWLVCFTLFFLLLLFIDLLGFRYLLVFKCPAVRDTHTHCVIHCVCCESFSLGSEVSFGFFLLTASSDFQSKKRRWFHGRVQEFWILINRFLYDFCVIFMWPPPKGLQVFACGCLRLRTFYFAQTCALISFIELSIVRLFHLASVKLQRTSLLADLPAANRKCFHRTSFELVHRDFDSKTFTLKFISFCQFGLTVFCLLLLLWLEGKLFHLSTFLCVEFKVLDFGKFSTLSLKI